MTVQDLIRLIDKYSIEKTIRKMQGISLPPVSGNTVIETYLIAESAVKEVLDGLIVSGMTYDNLYTFCKDMDDIVFIAERQKDYMCVGYGPRSSEALCKLIRIP